MFAAFTRLEVAETNNRQWRSILVHISDRGGMSLFIFDALINRSIDLSVNRLFIDGETDDRFLDFAQSIGGEVAVCATTFVVNMFE